MNNVPVIVGAQFYLAQRYEVNEEVLSKVEELLLQSIPLYWQQEGLIDVKVMKSTQQEQFIVMSNWESVEDAVQCANHSAWESINAQWRILQQAGKVKLVEIMHDQYELVE